MASSKHARQLVISAALVLYLSGARVEAQSAHYKDGSFTGDPVEILWGVVQVKAVNRRGKITDVQFLQMPFDRLRSVELTELAKPVLKSETIKSQSAQVDLVTACRINW